MWQGYKIDVRQMLFGRPGQSFCALWRTESWTSGFLHPKKPIGWGEVYLSSTKVHAAQFSAFHHWSAKLPRADQINTCVFGQLAAGMKSPGILAYLGNTASESGTSKEGKKDGDS